MIITQKKIIVAQKNASNNNGTERYQYGMTKLMTMAQKNDSNGTENATMAQKKTTMAQKKNNNGT